ncbi:MAG: hypothetical protein FWH29_05155 [Methanobrevibacter sp.]|nr:hypothetical protein [Methanobrevibacter sp.]
MPRISSIEILKRLKQAILPVRTKANLENFQILIIETYEKIGSYLEKILENFHQIFIYSLLSRL